jgi:hypothetical protein
MKTLRRLITVPGTKEIKMKTLYEYNAKVGTKGSTIVWLWGCNMKHIDPSPELFY